MTALDRNRTMDQVCKGSPLSVQMGVAATHTLYEGAMVSPLDANGYAVPAGTALSGAVVGVAEAQAANTAVGASNGDKSVNLTHGLFWRVNSGTNAVTQAHYGQAVYAEDDQTISSSPADGPLAGVCFGVDATLGVLVYIGPLAKLLATLGLSSQSQIPIPIPSFYDADGDPLAKFADGASTVPGYNLADSEAFGIRWNNHATPDPILGSVAMPQDLDASKDIVLHILASKTGATLADAVTFTTTAFFHTVGAAHDADADCGGVSTAMVGDATAKTVQEVTRTIAAADVPAAPASLSFTVKPTGGTLGTDDVIIEALWFEYTRKPLPT